MAPGRAGSGGEDGIDDKDAKNMFDSIGKIVHDKVKKDAEERGRGLQGDLKEAKFPTGRGHEKPQSESCNLNYEFDTNVTTGHSHPCEGRQGVRFSDTKGAKCYSYGIKVNDSSIGFCAPYRRLHLCVQNLEQIDPAKITNTHNLLVDVLLAAKYEGQSITQDYPKYRATYGDTGSTMCTMLARSFADIGDIVRGKDLYLGNKKKKQTEREKLEENLQKIFKEIYEELIKNGRNGVKDHYQDNDGNYYQLREDWWTLNRDQVWKAITCNAGGSQYFRQTCSEDPLSQQKCSCPNAGVPTYFDYVPQYLRWFEEWAEDFCRKKKKKVENLDTQCRGKDNSRHDRYCSRNGYDCQKTKRAIGKLRYGKQCISCLYACNPYVEWIEKQKEEFDKQKNKYDEEIKKYENGAPVTRRQKRDEGGTTKYEGYEKKFYEKLKDTNYKNVEDFLKKLNDEDICKRVEDDKGGKINFEKVNSASSTSGRTAVGASGTNNENEGTFYRSKYCQPCPLCGVKKTNNGDSGNKWEEKHKNEECKSINLYKPASGATPTEIKILKSGEGEKDIAEKLEQFCKTQSGTGGGADGSGSNSNSKELIEKWQCYEFKQLTKENKKNGVDDEEDVDEVKGAGGLCILQNTNKKSQNDPQEFQKTFNNFFYYWVVHMLKDSIYWRMKKLQRCLQNGNPMKCKDKCKGDCDCFQRWIGKKEKEWVNIKDHFGKQSDMKTETKSDPIVTLAAVLELEFANENSTKDAENNVSAEEAEEIKHLRQIIESEDKNQEPAGGSGTGVVSGTGKKTLMDKLIDYEKDEAELCIDNHPDDEKCSDSDDEDDHEEEVYVNNPCAKPSGSRHRALANEAAHQMHKAAKTQLAIRGRRRNLRADATKGKYIGGGTGKDLKENICKITLEHSNDSRSGNHIGPCYGKDGNDKRFIIGTEWQTGTDVQMSHTDLYLPPRRRHICTSNLEYLETKDGPLKSNDSDKVNDSFLGDVLLSAKYEANKIIEAYKNYNGAKVVSDPKHQETMCRAIRYSFADLGDIIKGRDMWDNDNGEKTTQTALKTVFGKIKRHLKGKDNDKYNDDYKLTKLRKDWWEANRHQVWKAMKCSLKDMSCDVRGVPLDDYIPQRLRWMTEWAEWYCKAQKKEYDELFMQCAKCMGKGQGCTSGDSAVCKQCKAACDTYKEKIKKWEKQWQNMQVPYITLYHQAKTTSTNARPTVFPDAGPDYQQVVDFFKELQKEIKNGALNRPKRSTDGTNNDPTVTSPYFTPAGYIHQEVPHMECQVQNQFCEKKNGVTPPSGTKKDDDYTFRENPKDHDGKCSCDKPPKKDACDIVGEILKDNDGTKQVRDCHPKNNDKNYPEWTCEKNKFENNQEGPCMPPRRQKLCLFYVADINEQKKIKTQDDLRKAFIKTAAAETFLSWHYYKSKHSNGKELDEKLNNGEIPPEFLRSMFYTYGDYRDICLNTDISAKTPDGHVKKATDFIRNFISKDGGKSGSGQTPQDWWDQNGEHIWHGMVCALTHGVTNTEKKTKIKTDYSYEKLNDQKKDPNTLEEFAKTPQFLRWMIEWSEHFCKKQSQKYNDLKEKCTGCIFDVDFVKHTVTCIECEDCKEKCQKYKSFITKWQNDWKTQSHKYQTLYTKATTSDNTSDSDEAEKKVLLYLKNLREPNGNTDKYSTAGKYINEKGYINDCEVSKQKDFHDNPKKDKDYTFREYPQKYHTECTCSTTQPKSACEIAKKVLKRESKTDYADLCNEKFKNGKKTYPRWNCNTNKFKSGEENACMPPRRQKLYLKQLKEFSGGTSKTELRKAFIECAAIETFFLWNKFKKDKEREDKEQNEETLYVGGGKTTLDQVAQKQLDDGEIPEEFKRQMFYTFGDYKDICLGKDIGNDVDEIEKKIKDVFTNGDAKDDQKRKNFWDKYGKDIWDGMVCALSYDTETQEKFESVHKNLMSTEKKNNYKSVTFPLKSGPSSGISLSDFAKKPQFIRWFEEWGEEFCRKRKIRIDKIKVDCRGKYEQNYCDGDGFDCTKMRPNKEKIFEDFHCFSCAKSCNSYKEWINAKQYEFNKQTEKYKKEIDNPKSNSDNTYDRTIYKTLKVNYPTATEFLETLKGPYSNNNTKDSTIDFNKPKDTFGHAKLCAPCPVFGVNCNKGVCSDFPVKDCNTKTFITADDVKNEEDSIEVDMFVIDNREKKIPDDLGVCQKSGIFEGIRKDEWICGNICKSNVCVLKNLKQGTDDEKNILFRTLFKRWLEYFLKDYNKIKDSLNPCMHNGKRNVCINGCKEKCNCVDKWIDHKTEEWKKIRDRYFKQYKIDNSEIYYDVRHFLEIMQPQTEIQKVIGDFKDLEDLEKASGCNYSDSLEKRKERDVVECLLNKLKNEIQSCKNQTDDGTNPNCVNPTPIPENPDIHDDDTTDPLDDDTSTTSVVPEICKDIVTPTTPEEEEKEPPEELPTAPDSGEDKAPEKKIPVTPPKTQQKKKKRQITPTYTSILPEMVSISAFPLSVGISFVALSYFVLKKKTKSSVGNLFQILQIPKSDYDIPTLKSKNRYIPYRSGQYKGKTYIYMEGDSSGDEKYAFMSDTTDVTSSESEYEELDINDIYVPGSPKYKTLIEVVLEPSGNNTTASGKNTPSDTQNYIQNDGIPSSKITDNEWNTLKHDFISNMLQSEQPKDVPNDYKSADIPFNTQPNTLYFDNNQEKPFITSIHDRDLYSGEEYSYNVNMVNSMDDTKYVSNNVYSGIDLINDTLSGNEHIDIYDEVLKRKENELFGTNHVKQTSIHSVAKLTNSDPLHNQLELFHKWLDRHRNMCEQWENHHERLAKLKEEWENKTHSGNTHPSDSNKTLNTDVSIQIHMDNPKPINEFTNMDTILEDLDKPFNEPYYYDMYDDDIYYDVNDHDTSTVDSNAMDVPSKVQIEMDVNTKLVKEKYPIGDVWDI